MNFIVGLDLGQVNDFSALAVLERIDHRRIWAVRDLIRFPLGSSYTEVTERVRRLMNSWPLRGSNIVVDRTGVGRAIVDQLRAPGLGGRLIPVTISGGENVVREPRGGGFRVPKRDLASVLQVLVQNRRLKVAASLVEAKALKSEFASFKVRISDAGHDSYGAGRSNEHDDLVIATALPVWWGERHRPLPSGSPEPAPAVPRGKVDEIFDFLLSEKQVCNPDLIAFGDYCPGGPVRSRGSIETRPGITGTVSHFIRSRR